MIKEGALTSLGGNQQPRQVGGEEDFVPCNARVQTSFLLLIIVGKRGYREVRRALICGLVSFCLVNRQKRCSAEDIQTALQRRRPSKTAESVTQAR